MKYFILIFALYLFIGCDTPNKVNKVTGPEDTNFYDTVKLGLVHWEGKLISRGQDYSSMSIKINVNNSPKSKLVLYIDNKNTNLLRKVNRINIGYIIKFDATITEIGTELIKGNLIRIISSKAGTL